MTQHLNSEYGFPLAARADFGEASATHSFDVVVTRGALVESRHRVSAAVVHADGAMLMSARDPHEVTWWRSCAKPFQVMPLVEGGGLEDLDWGTDQRALSCASHGGEPEHVAIASAMLTDLGLDEGDLACGPHEPLAGRGARLLRESGQMVTRLHNNCSGKHAAMLGRATLNRWPTEGYQQLAHAVQQGALESVASWSGLPVAQLATAVDGCGVAVFGLPLANMALAFARLVASAKRGDGAPARIVDAMTTRPHLVGGSDRFDTIVMSAFTGRVLCKVGAEGVHSLALVDRGIGIALKVEDGAPRAQYEAVMAVLAALDVHADTATVPERDALREFATRPIRNTRNETVGELRMGDEAVGDRVA